MVLVHSWARKLFPKAEANLGGGNMHTDLALPRCSEDFLLRAFECRYQFFSIVSNSNFTF